MNNLAKRGMKVVSSCLVCSQRVESTVHALRNCPTLKPVRALWPILKELRLLVEDMELLCMVLWRNWYRRNVQVHGTAQIHAVDVVPWARSFLADFKAANKVAEGPRRTCGVPVAPKWCLPENGVYKINTDAEADRKAGIGIIVRNWRGEVMASSSQMISRRLTNLSSLLNMSRYEKKFLMSDSKLNIIDAKRQSNILVVDSATLLKAALGFEVKETIATQSQTIKGMVDDDCASSTIPVYNVTSRILAMVIEWWNKHEIGTIFDEKELKE
ncbi:hypothetical protein Dsin_000559 [Dipteronia sinensis]|uniref:SKP1 component POZ domain-containing protein n=1 Tax=Dipteronia sinensis TaxID=43782 RepID=A0AAE0B322_9ROSI|nr:hypothetical protein Dsin_000559 [Dipteronia sinensis]